MDTKKELKILLSIIIVFIIVFFLPIENKSFRLAIDASLDLIRWYAREHVILCLLPAFFIAGFIAIFISQGSIIKYLGANAKKWIAYSIASTSGAILAVCSCTILPLFSSIHKKGAGLGPAIAFLYSGPAINILAIILTMRVLGIELGIARTIGAISFSIIIGLIMSFIYRKEEAQKKEEQLNFEFLDESKPFWQTFIHFIILVFILIFVNWGYSQNYVHNFWYYLWKFKWYITGVFSIFLMLSLIYFLNIKWQYVILGGITTFLSVLISNNLIPETKFKPLIPTIVGISVLSIITLYDKKNPENKQWTIASWEFAKQIFPLLAIGVLIAGFLLGSTHDGKTIPGIIPNNLIYKLVGGNSLFSNFFASVVGAFMYFATLTEIPIIQGLLNAGMGKGPALALLLAGPSLSLPNMLVIRSILGTQKTIVYVTLVIIMSTITGLLYGLI